MAYGPRKLPTKDTMFQANTSRVSVRVISLLVAFTLLAAACGSGDEGSDTQPINLDSWVTGNQPIADDDPDRDGGGEAGGGQASSGSNVDLDAWSSGQDNLVTPDPGDVSFDATFSDDTVIISPAAVRPAGGGHSYTIDAAAAGDLKPGSVLLVPGVALRKVTSIDRSGDQLRVETEFAALTDAIDDGDISWDVQLGPLSDFQTDPDTTPPAFSDVPAAMVPAEMGVTMPDGTMRQVNWTRSGNEEFPLQWRYSQDGLDYVFALGPGAEHLTLYIQVTRDVGGRTAMAYTAEGTVRAPRTSGNVSIRGGALKAADINQQGLHGTLDLSVAVAGGGGKIPFDFELPGIWFKYIVPVGPIPLTVGINARVIGDVEVPVEASAQANAHFTFGGDAGFKFAGSSVQPSVNMPDLGIVPEPADSAATFGNYVNAEFGVAFPSISISLFDQGVIPTVFPHMTIGSRLQWGPLCKSGYMRIGVKGSYDFKILGVNLLSSDAVDLVEPYERRGSGEGCPSE